MVKRTRDPLSTERIEGVALELIETDGLESFSTRRLAARLGCEAMSVYHYFPSKAHLMDALLDRVLGEMRQPDEDLDWIDRLRFLIVEYRGLAHRHPNFFRFVVLHRHNTRAGLSVLETFLRTLGEGGFDAEMTGRYFRVLGYYMVGAALDETSGYAKGPSAVEPLPEEEVARDFPTVVAVNPFFKPKEHQATFDLGLEMLLQTVAAASSATGQPRPARPASLQAGKRRGVRSRALPSRP